MNRYWCSCCRGLIYFSFVVGIGKPFQKPMTTKVVKTITKDLEFNLQHE